MFTAILIGFLLLALLMLFVIFSAFWGFLITRVPFVPTDSGDIKFIVEKLGLTDRDVFFDLGSGGGKVVFLVNQMTGARCVGFELTWWTHLIAKIRLKIKDLRLKQKSKVQFINQNFFKVDWSEANYIYAYLFPPLMGRVKEKFLLDCKPGSVAIVRDFPFPDLKPSEVYNLPKNHEIYLYRKALD